MFLCNQTKHKHKAVDEAQNCWFEAVNFVNLINGVWYYDARKYNYTEYLMDIHKASTIVITCGRGLTNLLRREVRGLGFSVESWHDMGLEIKGSLYDCWRLNLSLRTASAVLYLLKDFGCRDVDEFYEGVLSVEWEGVLSVEESVCIVPHIDTPAMDSDKSAGMVARDAILNRVREKTGRRVGTVSNRDHLVVNLYWKDDRCRLFLNTSGQRLSKRGYSKESNSATIEGALAAGAILTTGYSGRLPFVVPMCGDGTFAIEAALIAAGRGPGLLRNNFGFMHIKDFDAQAWKQLRKETRKSNSRQSSAAPIIATDSDQQTIEEARKNARTAGVEHLIEFSVCDLAETPVPAERGIIIAGPEWGREDSEQRAVKRTYKKIHDLFKQKCAGYAAYLFTDKPSATKKVALVSDKCVLLFNGATKCQLLRYQIYPADSRKEVKSQR